MQDEVFMKKAIELSRFAVQVILIWRISLEMKDVTAPK